MALNFNSISYTEREFISRLDSKYYQLQETLVRIEDTEDMKVNKLGDFVVNMTDGEHAGQTFVKEGILFLKNSSIKDFDISVSDGFYISEQDHERLSRSALNSEDVLFTTIGHLGSAAIVPCNFGEANMNQNFVKMEIDKEKISPYYITCFLNSKFARSQINALLTGNIQSILTYPKIKNITVIYPKNQSVQNEIENDYKHAIKLSQNADTLIKEALRILEHSLELKNYKKNTNRIFSVEDKEFCKDEALWTPKYFLPEYIETENFIKESFNYVDLGKVADIFKGDEPGSEFYCGYLDKGDSDIPFVRTSDLYNYQIDLSPDNFIDSLTYERLNQDIQEGDILFSKDGKVGETAIVTSSDKALFQSGIAIIRINENGKKIGLTQEYIFTTMMCEKIGKYTAYRHTVTASTIPHLREHFIKQMVIPIIEEENIKKITENIGTAFKYIDKKKQLICKCQKRVNDINNEFLK